MVAYGFKTQFAEPIIDGSKTQTIRAVGKRRHARPEERLQLYTAMRTKQCRKIGEADCFLVLNITIDFDTVSIKTDQWSIGPGRRSNRPRSASVQRQLDDFARMDGFADWSEMLAFWQKNHFKRKMPHGRWKGVLVRWKNFEAA